MLIVVDGQRVTGRIDGAIDLRRFTIENVERIEIVKGAGSVLYGSDAIAGVVNIVTRPPEPGVQAEAHASYGSWATLDLSGRVSGPLRSRARAVATRGADTRILSLGGPLTELLSALGVGDRIVGADTSSYYPSEAEALPKVGYQRQISVEGVLALAPTLVVHSDQAGPRPALEQIAAAGIELSPACSAPRSAAVARRCKLCFAVHSPIRS